MPTDGSLLGALLGAALSGSVSLSEDELRERDPEFAERASRAMDTLNRASAEATQDFADARETFLRHREVIGAVIGQIGGNPRLLKMLESLDDGIMLCESVVRQGKDAE